MLQNEKHKREVYAKFLVVDIPLAYNVILDHSVLNYHGIVINMCPLCLNLLTQGELAVIRSSQKSVQEYYRHSTKSLKRAMMLIDLLKKPDSHTDLEPADSMEKVLLELDKKRM